MNRFKTILLIFALLPLVSFADGGLQVFFNYSSFNTSKNKPYIETYMSVIGETATFVLQESGEYNAEIAISIILKQNGAVADFRKFNLLSPSTSSQDEAKPNFIDQQRIFLDNGVYNLEVEIQDLNSSDTSVFKFNDIIQLNYPENKTMFSDIQMIESYSATENPGILTKNGYDLVPYISNYYPENLEKLSFYAELYFASNAIAEGEKFLLRYYIESYEKKVIMSDFNRFQKQNAKDANAIIGEFVISKLATGNYNLVVEARDKENSVFASKRYFFQRSNPEKNINLEDIASVEIAGTFTESFKSIDELKDFLRCLSPISDSRERIYAKNQIEYSDLSSMQQYFYNFWQQRNPYSPEQEWLNYKTQVDEVEKSFGTRIKKGYETDQGRIYLKYGTPNSIDSKKFESNSYPYELWHYHKLDNQMNRFFIFWNPPISGFEYHLLHSNVRGEIYNPDYKEQLENTEFDGSDLRYFDE